LGWDWKAIVNILCERNHRVSWSRKENRKNGRNKVCCWRACWS